MRVIICLLAIIIGYHDIALSGERIALIDISVDLQTQGSDTRKVMLLGVDDAYFWPALYEGDGASCKFPDSWDAKVIASYVLSAYPQSNSNDMSKLRTPSDEELKKNYAQPLAFLLHLSSFDVARRPKDNPVIAAVQATSIVATLPGTTTYAFIASWANFIAYLEERRAFHSRFSSRNLFPKKEGSIDLNMIISNYNKKHKSWVKQFLTDGHKVCTPIFYKGGNFDACLQSIGVYETWGLAPSKYVRMLVSFISQSKPKKKRAPVINYLLATRTAMHNKPSTFPRDTQ